MSNTSKATILAQLLSVASTLSNQPQEILAPYERHIIVLTHQLSTLAASLNHNVADAPIPNPIPLSERLNFGRRSRNNSATAGTPGANWDVRTLDSADSEAFDDDDFTTPTPDIDRRNHTDRLLDAAQALFRASQQRIDDLAQPATFEWFSQSSRLLHLNSIFTLSRHQAARQLGLSDRLLLLCSCMLLATEFRDFESGNGWQAKQDTLCIEIANGLNPSVQRIQKHSKTFFERLAIEANDEKKLDAGLRLGTKLNVVEDIGRRRGLGAFLSLLFGFELSRLSRMPYSKFLDLATSLEDSIQSPSSMLATSAMTYSSWWEKCKSEYKIAFGSFGKPAQDQIAEPSAVSSDQSRVTESELLFQLGNRSHIDDEVRATTVSTAHTDIDILWSPPHLPTNQAGIAEGTGHESLLADEYFDASTWVPWIMDTAVEVQHTNA